MKDDILKRFVFNPLVIGFILSGCIIISYVSISLVRNPSLYSHGDIQFPSDKPFLNFTLYSSQIALLPAVKIIEKSNYPLNLPIWIYVYMFLIQAIVYFLLGNFIGLLSSNNFVRGTMIFGLLILGLVWAFNINPVEYSVVYRPIQGSTVHYLLLIFTLASWMVAMLLFRFSSIASVLAMLFTQVVIFWIIGNIFKPVWVGIYGCSRIIFTKKG